jgi:hypothetical protein
MQITCPYCHSEATLAPNPAHAEQISLPLYLLTCSGCNRTSVRQEHQELLVAALVGNRHGSGSHELTVAAGGVGHTSFHTDPTGRTTLAVEHSDLLEYVTSRIRASDTFTLVLRTVEVGARYRTPDGGIPYTAVRGWVVTDGEIHALTGQEVWEASYRDSESGEPLDPEADIHYVDADDIPRPYPW